CIRTVVEVRRGGLLRRPGGLRRGRRRVSGKGSRAMTPQEERSLGSGRCIKLETQLSLNLEVLVMFVGGVPDGTAFARLREALAVLEKSLTGGDAVVAPKPRKLKNLVCEIHPGAGRHPKNNRCLKCLPEQLKKFRKNNADRLT